MIRTHAARPGPWMSAVRVVPSLLVASCLGASFLAHRTALAAPLPEPGQWQLSSRAEVLEGEDALRKALSEPIEDTDCVTADEIAGGWKQFLSETQESGCTLGIVSETADRLAWRQVCKSEVVGTDGKLANSVETTEANATVKSRREWSWDALITGSEAKIRFHTEARWISAKCEKP